MAAIQDRQLKFLLKILLINVFGLLGFKYFLLFCMNTKRLSIDRETEKSLNNEIKFIYLLMPVTQLVTRTKYRLLVLSFAFLAESYLKI